MDKVDLDVQSKYLLRNKLSKMDVSLRIKELLFSQDLAVLCMRGDLAAYGSLVAFHVSDNIRNIIFATLNYTRKSQLLEKCGQVAMVVDSRNQNQGSMSKISAVTISGEAKKIEDPMQIEDAKNKILKKHHYINEMVSSESCILFNVEITRCLYVTHLQEVSVWMPS